MNQSAQRILENVLHRVERLHALDHQLEARLSPPQRQLAALTPSLPPSRGYGGTGLARAFAGKLDPQNPTDEPASRPLERIKTQHGSRSLRDARK